MRLRHVPGSEEAVKGSPFVISDPAAHRGFFTACFPSPGPLEVEIGTGKGKFLTELASLNPGVCYLGVERSASVLLHAIKRREEAGVGNLLFLCTDAAGLGDIFAPGEVAKIYLNFPDPWPKERCAKRRLTAPSFLQVYNRILKPGGVLEFKTDNAALFSWSLLMFRREGWDILAETEDLCHSGMATGNVATEYEIRFSAEGKPICKLIAAPGSGKNA